MTCDSIPWCLVQYFARSVYSRQPLDDMRQWWVILTDDWQLELLIPYFCMRVMDY